MTIKQELENNQRPLKDIDFECSVVTISNLNTEGYLLCKFTFIAIPYFISDVFFYFDEWVKDEIVI